MQEEYVGKTLRNEKDEEFIVLSQLTYKNIPCVYVMRITSNNTEGEKMFFQLSTDGDIHLVSIKSKKMLNALSETLFKNSSQGDRARKIEPNESIADYMDYLDNFYKNRVVTIVD